MDNGCWILVAIKLPKDLDFLIGMKQSKKKKCSFADFGDRCWWLWDAFFMPPSLFMPVFSVSMKFASCSRAKECISQIWEHLLLSLMGKRIN